MKNPFESNDFYASAYLVASGIPLKDHFRSGQITTFIFEDSDQLQDLLNSYYSLQGAIIPVHYASALKNLKSIIHGAYINKNKYHEHKQKGAL
ncbi:MAG: hypothetical protein ISR95_00205 [Candidatus Marinimicrobia bacterium]|nr:hypothetical protein [Candidatus Neomarinimicrobiota bacterium]